MVSADITLVITDAFQGIALRLSQESSDNWILGKGGRGPAGEVGLQRPESLPAPILLDVYIGWTQPLIPHE